MIIVKAIDQEGNLPNIQSNKKNLRKTVKRFSKNRAILSRMRTQYKKLLKMIHDNAINHFQTELSFYYKYADKAVKNGVVKMNHVARKKSEITKKAMALLNKTGGNHAV